MSHGCHDCNTPNSCRCPSMGRLTFSIPRDYLKPADSFTVSKAALEQAVRNALADWADEKESARLLDRLFSVMRVASWCAAIYQRGWDRGLYEEPLAR